MPSFGAAAHTHPQAARCACRSWILPTLLDAGAISHSIVGRTLLRDATLSLAHGKVLALVEPNGAGKRTLLNLLTGDVRRMASSMNLDGEPLAQLHPMFGRDS